MERNGLNVVVLEPGYEEYSKEAEVLSSWNPVFKAVPASASEQERIEAVKEADAVMVREAKVSAGLISEMQKCRVIVRYGVGVDNIDLDAAQNKKICVANVPDYGSDEVSCHAVTLMLSAARHVATRDRDVRNGIWGVGQKQKVYSFRGATLGIIGFGRIAQSFLEKMRAFGVGEVLVYDPHKTADALAEHGCKQVDINTLCAEADLISLHAPLTPETRALIGREQFDLMKKTCVLVNTSRGPLIDEEAMIDALAAHKIHAAGIDVFEQEPPSSSNSLFGMENVIVSDHTGWYSETSVQELQSKAAHEILRVLEGGQPRSWVNAWEESND